ncbi:MAG: Zn-ribbon domain-containing OB-fold protein [Acidimicrobiia bacterium]
MSDAPRLLEPPASEEAEPFWEATRRGELVLPWCRACDRPFWYPRKVCPACLGDDIDWRPSAGVGEVYAVSVQHRPGPGRDPADGPYAVALVDLPEGVRIMTNIVGCPPDEVTVGTAVRVAWRELSDGRKLPQMVPD